MIGFEDRDEIIWLSDLISWIMLLLVFVFVALFSSEMKQYHPDIKLLIIYGTSVVVLIISIVGTRNMAFNNLEAKFVEISKRVAPDNNEFMNALMEYTRLKNQQELITNYQLYQFEMSLNKIK
jgi:glucan phosphoethanolaminetransferase (alkaline phosphatase superfamily)